MHLYERAVELYVLVTVVVIWVISRIANICVVYNSKMLISWVGR